MKTRKIHVTGAKRGKTRATKSRLVLVLYLIGWEGDARFLNQSQSIVKQDQSNSGLLSTLNWKPFYSLYSISVYSKIEIFDEPVQEDSLALV